MTKRPNWDELFEIASSQDGLFMAEQAAKAGFYRQLLRRYIESGRVRRVRRGIYRIVHYPQCEHEELAELWLWTKQAGVFSHETALALYGLSDVLPKRVYITVPDEWRQRRMKIPRGVALYYAAVRPEERTWVEAVPVTKPDRTLFDCVDGHLSQDLLIQAIQQAQARGLVPPERLAEISRVTGYFGAT
jgi:predicted transcriptional regulator of viral defense system